MENSQILFQKDKHQVTSNESGEPQGLTDEEQQLLTGLASEWERSQTETLKARHRMGTLLNNHFGTPAKRQARGQAVMKLAAERLQIAVSELSRMRWLAHHFKDIDDLKSRHPDVDSWTKVKELLPTLRPSRAEEATSSATQGEEAVALFTGLQDSGKKQRRKQKSSATDLREASRFLKDLSSKLQRAEFPTVAEKEGFLQKLKEFAEAVPDFLAIRPPVILVSSAECIAA